MTAYGPGNPPPEFDPWDRRLSFDDRIAPALTPQDALLDALDDLLDSALHAPECWISATETNCECLIGKVRAVLPHCDAIVVSQATGQSYRCVRVAHPAAPNSHVFY